MKKRDLNRFKKAVERKREAAEARSRMTANVPRGAGGADPAAEQQLVAHERPQGVPDPRAKSSGHGQKTADKWNQ
jgi:hypothetical protein